MDIRNLIISYFAGDNYVIRFVHRAGDYDIRISVVIHILFRRRGSVWMKQIRVFPRKTNATPDDENVRFGTPTLFDEADEIHVSVAFDWDKERGERLAEAWRVVGKVSIGGPAYNPAGGEFEPGMYLKRGHVITSRGCPNRCWFCRAWRNEGNIRELEIKDGWIIHDNNLLATSRHHQESVFKMLLRQPEFPRFTGGFEPGLFKAWHAEWMEVLRPKTIWFAYDEEIDYEPFRKAMGLFTPEFLRRRIVSCYCLIGYEGDTIDAAEKRLRRIVELGAMPQAMLYNRRPEREWRRFQREWANRVIVGKKVSEYTEARP